MLAGWWDPCLRAVSWRWAVGWFTSGPPPDSNGLPRSRSHKASRVHLPDDVRVLPLADSVSTLLAHTNRPKVSELVPRWTFELPRLRWSDAETAQPEPPRRAAIDSGWSGARPGIVTTRTPENARGVVITGRSTKTNWIRPSTGRRAEWRPCTSIAAAPKAAHVGANADRVGRADEHGDMPGAGGGEQPAPLNVALRFVDEATESNFRTRQNQRDRPNPAAQPPSAARRAR